MRYVCGRLLGSYRLGYPPLSGHLISGRSHVATLNSAVGAVRSRHAHLRTCSTHNGNDCKSMFHTGHRFEKKGKHTRTRPPHRGKQPSDSEKKMDDDTHAYEVLQSSTHTTTDSSDDKLHMKLDIDSVIKSAMQSHKLRSVTDNSFAIYHTKDSYRNRVAASTKGLGETAVLQAEFEDFVRARRLGKTIVRDDYKCNFLVFQAIHSLARLIDSSHIPDAEFESFISASVAESFNNKPFIDNKHWDDLYSAFTQECYFLQSMFINIVLSCIVYKGRADLALSFMNYMRRHCVPKTIELARLASLCAKDYPEFAFEVYHKFIANERLDNMILKVLIKGFAESTKWRMCFDWVDRLERQSGGYNFRTVLPLLKQLFIENDLDTVHTIYMKANSDDTGILKVMDLRNHIFHWWWEGLISFEAMLDVASRYNMIFDQRRTENIISCFKGESERTKPMEKLTVKVAKVRNTHVPQDYVTAEQFDRLKMAFAKVFVTKDQIYRHTSPDEFRQYLNVLKELPTIDVVMDVPNIAYSVDNTQILSILKRVRRLGKTILAVGTKQDLFFDIQKDYPKGVYMYKVPYGSPDDLFTLMSAIHFGVDTMIFSNDKFRSYKQHLDGEIQEIFTLWQKCRQITHFLDSDIVQLPYNTMPHKHNDGWHIPFHNYKLPLVIRQKSFHTTTTVLCITKKT